MMGIAKGYKRSNLSLGDLHWGSHAYHKAIIAPFLCQQKKKKEGAEKRKEKKGKTERAPTQS